LALTVTDPGVAEITLDAVRLAAACERLSLEIGGGIEPAETDRLGRIAGSRDATSQKCEGALEKESGSVASSVSPSSNSANPITE
jgi:hypothetical protein